MLKAETQDTIDETVNTEYIAHAMLNFIEEKCATLQRQSPFARMCLKSSWMKRYNNEARNK